MTIKWITNPANNNSGKIPDPMTRDDADNTLLSDYSSSTDSLRFNTGKTQTREIDPAFILGIGEVLTKSREKYTEGNWMKETKYSVPYESLQRHLAAFWSGEEIDKESGSHHLLHCATNIMFLYYHTQNGSETSDDRLFKKKK